MQLEDVTVDLDSPEVAVGLVLARGCRVAPSPESMEAALTEAVASAPDDETVRKAVRDLLRYGKYKPTGRGKPACEYLLKAAREQRFPRINNLVDINNLVSLSSQLPISLIDLSRAGTDRFMVRRGREGERYVFNSAGQEIDLQDLLLVACLPADSPCANPVKDSMATKLTDESTDVLAVIYAPVSHMERLKQATGRFVEALKAWGNAAAPASAVTAA